MYGENIEHPSLIPQNEGRKLTKTRLAQLLAELNLQYSLEGEGGSFDIIITTPPEHAEEKRILEQDLLNDSHLTKFDEEGLRPLLWAIKNSTNLTCTVKSIDNKSKYIVSVSKK